jgi:hypothetical protein
LTAHNLAVVCPSAATQGGTLMDRVTGSFLTEFVKANELEKLPPDKQFENFATFVAVRRHYTGETFDTTEIHMGGGGDTALDSVAIIVNGSLVTDVESLTEHLALSENLDVTFIFVQAEQSPHFDGKKLSDFGFGVKDFFDPNPKLTRNKSVKDAAKIMESLYDNGTKFKPDNPVCRLYYVTTGIWSGDGDLEARRQATESDLRSLTIFREVSFACLGAEGLQQSYRQTKNAVMRDFTFAHRTLLPEISGVTEAYIGYVPLSEFMNIVTDDSGDLIGSIFSENVRDWQDYTADVNKEIRETVQSTNKDRFAIMNNGITMIARALKPMRRDRFQIEDFQIVNGCQTTHVLFENSDKKKDESIFVPIRIVATEDENVIKAIIKGTNRQTKVEDDQFFALTDFAEQLEDYFQTFPEQHRLYYERRSGQYIRMNIPTTRIVPHKTLVRAVGSMFMEVPHQTIRRYQSLREAIGKDIFAKGHKLDPYYVSALALYKLEVNFRTERLDRRLIPARFHILLAMRYLADPSPTPRMNARDMEKYCDKIKTILWDGAKADALCKRAAKVVEKVANGDLENDNVRTQPFTEGVIELCRKEIQRA